jgi:hypothetical protein
MYYYLPTYLTVASAYGPTATESAAAAAASRGTTFGELPFGETSFGDDDEDDTGAEREEFGSGGNSGGHGDKKKKAKKQCTIAFLLRGRYAELSETKQIDILTNKLAPKLRQSSIGAKEHLFILPYENKKLGRYQGNPVLIIW